MRSTCSLVSGGSMGVRDKMSLPGGGGEEWGWGWGVGGH